MFSYKIKNNILEISRNLEFIKKISKFKLTNPIIKEQLNNSDYITKIYNESYELFDLSFYLYKINKNSILFIKELNEDILSSLSKIDNINNKIKVIIIESLSHEINQSIKKLINFMTNTSIPIFKLGLNDYEAITDFFIKGKYIKFALYINID